MPTFIRGNSLYTTVSGPSWTQAETDADAIGGHLVTIDNASENDWLVSVFGSSLPNLPTGTAWIGLTDSAIEGRWVSPTGIVAQYTNWGSNVFEPSGGTLENYAEITLYATALTPGWRVGGWNDAPDNAQRNAGIAEIPLVSSILLPATIKEGSGVFTTSINLSAGSTASGNLANGTTAYWKVTGITADDLATGALTGSGVITGGKLDLQHSLIVNADQGEKFEVSVFSDSLMTRQIGSTSSATIEEGAPVRVLRGNSLYATVSGPSWTQAEANSVALGGHLASIANVDEQNFLWNSFGLYAFIGLTDEVVEGTWKWSDGSPVTYFNWLTTIPTPDNATGPGGITQDYVVMGHPFAPAGSLGQWDDQWHQR